MTIMNTIKIIDRQERSDTLIAKLIKVWEDSVRKTHLFLSEDAISEIKEFVPEALREVKQLVVVVNDLEEPIGFMGVQDNSIEMLFISPDQRGKGIGKELVLYGIETFSISLVTVNEQNSQAFGFYEHLGFKTYKRTECDEQGRPYPLLYMKL